MHSSSDDHLKFYPLSVMLIPSGRLKNTRDVDKWSSLRICLSVRGLSVTTDQELYLCRWVLGQILL